MAEIIETGGSAFPGMELQSNDGSFGCFTTYGMTLRDWFAAHAMNGLLEGDKRALPDDACGRLATLAYVIADAMLKARKS